VFGNGTTNDQWTMHTYNPNVGGSPTITQSFWDIQTVVEYQRDLLWLINMAQNNTVNFHAYLCKPRRAFTYTELNGAIGGGSSLSFTSSSTAVLAAVMTLAKLNCTTWYQANPSSGTGMNAMSWTQPGEKPFNNAWFCHNFKIIKSKQWKLRPGRKALLTMTQAKYKVSALTLDFELANAAGSPIYNQYVALDPRHCRFWLVFFYGEPVPWLETGNLPNLKAYDVPVSYLSTYHIRQFCMRPSSSFEGSLVGSITGAQSLTGTTAYALSGRPRYLGEAVVETSQGAAINFTAVGSTVATTPWSG